jgi:general secretion pathway protein B
MSFILDALKKSENQRQRHIGPSLADVQVRRRESNRPWWVLAVAALLVINLGVLLAVLTRNNGASGNDRAAAATLTPQPASAAAATPVSADRSDAGPGPAASARAASPAHELASPEVRSLADEAGAFDAAASDLSPQLAGPDAAAMVPEGPPMVRPIHPPAVAPAASGAAAGSNSADSEVLPTLSDLVASGKPLPELHLDMHVHSNNAAERFVFVNMRKYVEGQSLSEGLKVERITGDGVILNQHGLRFLLPRQ